MPHFGMKTWCTSDFSHEVGVKALLEIEIIENE
jgi:hypothetical protein